MRRWFLTAEDKWKGIYPSNSDYIRDKNDTISTNITELYNSTVAGQNYEYYTLKFHATLQKYIHYWNDDDKNDSLALMQAMKNSELNIGTDGSYDPAQATGAGAAVASDSNSLETTICFGAKCQVEHGMTSLTAEQYGIISGLLLIHILLLQSGRPTFRCKINFWVDNEEALRRITSDEEDDIRLKAFGVRDYGSMTVMRELKQCLPSGVTINFQKVKSHQEGPLEDLPIEAQLNHLADQMANTIRTQSIGPSDRYKPHSREGICIYDHTKTKIHDVGSYITMKIKGDDLSEYYTKKHGWNKNIMDLIDWIGIDRFLSKLNPSSAHQLPTINT